VNFPPPTERQARIIWLGLTALALAAFASVIVMFIWGLGRVLDVFSPVLWPLAAAGVLAYLLDPVVDFFERKGLSRTRAIISVFAIALVIVTGVFATIIPPIVSQTRHFVARVPEISGKVEQRVENWVNNPPGWFQKYFKEESKPADTHAPVINTNTISSASDTNAIVITTNSMGANDALEKALQSITDWLTGFVPKAGSWIGAQALSWFSVLVGLALVPIYAFYLLLEKQGIQSKWTNYLPVKDSAFKDELVFILRSINGYLIAFFRGQVLVAICDGALYGIGFLIIGLPYAILLGAAAMVLTIIPYIGAIIIFIVAMIIALVQFGDWQHPLLVLVVFGIVQTLEGLVISPRIMRGRVGLHPLTIIIAVMIGTTLLGGLLGGILAIPLTAVLRVLMTRYVWKKRET
jgi:predicted PurR-regulated permease PerM